MVVVERLSHLDPPGMTHGVTSVDPKNKAALTRPQHIEACRYWNKAINELRSPTEVRLTEL